MVMSANPLYTRICKIPSSGPTSNLLKLQALYYVRLWSVLVISLTSPSLSLFPRRESGFWVSYLVPFFKLFSSLKIRKQSLLHFVTLLSRAAQCLKTLQRFAGKTTSFSMAVPAAQLYAREVYHAISLASGSSCLVRVACDLRIEIAHWQFLDSWSRHLSWIDKHHLLVNVTSDASTYAWDGIIDNSTEPQRVVTFGQKKGGKSQLR